MVVLVPKDFRAKIQVGAFITGCTRWIDDIVWLYTETNDLQSILRCFLNTREASHHRYAVIRVHICAGDMCLQAVEYWLLPKWALSWKVIKWSPDVNFTIKCVKQGSMSSFKLVSYKLLFKCTIVEVNEGVTS